MTPVFFHTTEDIDIYLGDIEKTLNEMKKSVFSFSEIDYCVIEFLFIHPNQSSRLSIPVSRKPNHLFIIQPNGYVPFL